MTPPRKCDVVRANWAAAAVTATREMQLWLGSTRSLTHSASTSRRLICKHIVPNRHICRNLRMAATAEKPAAPHAESFTQASPVLTIDEAQYDAQLASKVDKLHALLHGVCPASDLPPCEIFESARRNCEWAGGPRRKMQWPY